MSPATAISEQSLEAPMAAHSAHRFRSRAGRAAIIRPAKAADRAALAAMLTSLSATTVERRYFSFRVLAGAAAEREAARLTRPDGGQLVLVAALDMPGEPIVAVAELVFAGTPGQAECAIVVADAFQGEGIGRAMARQIVIAAEVAAITRLSATTHAANSRVRRLIATGGRPYAARFAGPDVTYEVELAG